MQLLLEPPCGDKNWIFSVNELKGDDDFVPWEPSFTRCPDSERWEVNALIREEAEKAGIKSRIFNQCLWAGTTGWEFWTDDVVAIRAVVAGVAERLSLPVDLTALPA